MNINPTAILMPFGGRVEIRVFGRNKGTTDWNISPLQTAEDIRRNTALWSQFEDIARAAGVTDIYAPSVSKFNATICSLDSLLNEISQSKYLGCTSTNNELRIWRGSGADGCEVPVGRAVWFSSADCPTIITCDNYDGHIIAAHAGRQSLIKEPSADREHSSVLELIQAIRARDEVKVFSCCGIGSVSYRFPYDHKYTATINAAVYESLWHNYRSVDEAWVTDPMRREFILSLHDLIRLQCKKIWKFAEHGTDCANTYNDVDTSGEMLWWSHRRWAEGGKTDCDGRNGILVIRRW